MSNLDNIALNGNTVSFSDSSSSKFKCDKKTIGIIGLITGIIVVVIIILIIVNVTKNKKKEAFRQLVIRRMRARNPNYKGPWSPSARTSIFSRLFRNFPGAGSKLNTESTTTSKVVNTTENTNNTNETINETPVVEEVVQEVVDVPSNIESTSEINEVIDNAIDTVTSDTNVTNDEVINEIVNEVISNVDSNTTGSVVTNPDVIIPSSTEIKPTSDPLTNETITSYDTGTSVNSDREPPNMTTAPIETPTSKEGFSWDRVSQMRNNSYLAGNTTVGNSNNLSETSETFTPINIAMRKYAKRLNL